MDIFGFDPSQMEYWHWWVAAGVFLALEVFTMSFFFLWLGLAAVLAGLVHALLPGLSWQAQYIIWALTAVAGALGWRAYKKKNPDPIKSEEPFLNRRGEQYIGRIFTLSEPLVNGFGRVRVDDSLWRVESAQQDIPAGRKIRVLSLNGTVLKVEEITGGQE